MCHWLFLTQLHPLSCTPSRLSTFEERYAIETNGLFDTCWNRRTVYAEMRSRYAAGAVFLSMEKRLLRSLTAVLNLDRIQSTF